MRTTCIKHPESERFIIIRPWQIRFCNGNECAAALLSYFEYWHNFKLQDVKNRDRENDVSELHGEGRIYESSLVQFHTFEDFEEGLLIYKKDSIRAALKLLESLNIIEIFKNPNTRFKFDKTQYFNFHPEILNAWLLKYSMGEIPKIVVEKPTTVVGNPISVVVKPTSNNRDTLSEIHNIETPFPLNSEKEFKGMPENFSSQNGEGIPPAPHSPRPPKRQQGRKRKLNWKLSMASFT